MMSKGLHPHHLVSQSPIAGIDSFAVMGGAAVAPRNRCHGQRAKRYQATGIKRVVRARECQGGRSSRSRR